MKLEMSLYVLKKYTLSAKKFGQEILNVFFTKFGTIFKGSLDDCNFLYNFQNFTYFEDLQNVTV